MRHKTMLRTLCICSLVVLFLLPASAQPPQGRGRGIYGEWEITMPFGERQMPSILSFSRNQEGQYTGQSITFLGVFDLEDITFDENKLSYTRVIRLGGQTFTSKFSGTIEDGKLSGTLSGQRGDNPVKGQRLPRMPRCVGIWDMTIKAGEREYTGTLAVTVDKKGNLKGLWKSSRGESEMSNLAYENRKLTFKRMVGPAENPINMAFEGAINDDTLEGTFTSDRGESTATAKRVGAAAIGIWDLTLASGRGERKQRLVINPDLSVLYGPIHVDKVDLESNTVSFSFKARMPVGDQTLETSFKGTMAETKLTGDVTTSRLGSRKVTGTKRPSGRRRRAQQ